MNKVQRKGKVRTLSFQRTIVLLKESIRHEWVGALLGSHGWSSHGNKCGYSSIIKLNASNSTSKTAPICRNAYNNVVGICKGERLI